MARRKAVVELWPVYVQTVGLMKEHNTPVAAVCSKCRTWMKVEVTGPQLQLDRRAGALPGVAVRRAGLLHVESGQWCAVSAAAVRTRQ